MYRRALAPCSNRTQTVCGTLVRFNWTKALNLFNPSFSTVPVSNAGFTGISAATALRFFLNWVRPVFFLQANTTEWTPFLLTTHAAVVPINRDTKGECRATWHAVLCFNLNRKPRLHSKQACYSLSAFQSFQSWFLFLTVSPSTVRSLTRQKQAW